MSVVKISRKRLGEKFKSAREARRWSANDVAHFLRVARNTYLNWESGKTEPLLLQGLELAKLLGIDTAHFEFDEQDEAAE